MTIPKVDMPIIVRLQREKFDPGNESNQFLSGAISDGAAVTFTGIVRSPKTNPIISMTLEHYPELAQSQLEGFATQATNRFNLSKATIIHRYGEMVPGEPIVQVMTLSPHRKDAFEGAQFIMDFLKTDAPFWKKEKTVNGQSWVEAKDIDEKAKQSWQ
ncbi:MAG: molybdenum cofactor biosynthesis protein MoaE [Devosiaceae bacterium]|nr:molybdenum cofactor biosynthesis protein MoaE [Devosiaceae bacterium]